MLKQQVQVQALLVRLRDRVERDEGGSLVETMVYAGAIALVVVAVVAVLRTWAVGKASNLQ